MWSDFKIDPEICDAGKPHDPLHFFHPKKKHQLVFRLIQHIFIFELIERFSDVHVMEQDYTKFYPIHYFSKEFFRNYQLFLNDAEHVFIEFPGIVDSSGSIGITLNLILWERNYSSCCNIGCIFLIGPVEEVLVTIEIFMR